MNKKWQKQEALVEVEDWDDDEPVDEVQPDTP